MSLAKAFDLLQHDVESKWKWNFVWNFVSLHFLLLLHRSICQATSRLYYLVGGGGGGVVIFWSRRFCVIEETSHFDGSLRSTTQIINDREDTVLFRRHHLRQ